MSLDADHVGRRTPTLLQLCQKVATNHVDAIDSFGDDLPFELIEPILGSCSPETLVRLEEASPHIEKDTPAIWKNLCCRTFPMMSEQYTCGAAEEPENWRNQFFIMREAEARRLEEVGSKIRSQRLEAEERKRESQIKITDKLPPTKRARHWTQMAGSMPRNTLFQKVRSQASVIQKSTYGPRMLPSMPPSKTYPIVGHNAGAIAKLLPPASPTVSSTTRVTVTAVRRPSRSSSTKPVVSNCPPKPATPSVPGSSPVKAPPIQQKQPQISSPPKPLPAMAPKKDKTASLFMPKHRALSQLPTSARPGVPSN